jgi:uroporphyrinogen-III synthase
MALKDFKDANIALLEARMSSEMAGLISRYGGKPYSVPAVREVPVDSRGEVAAFIDHLVSGQLQIVTFFTGVGANALFQEAERLGQLPALLDALQNVTVVCRGPKPSAVLKRYNVPIALTAREPYTTTELLEVLLPATEQGTHVAVIHYGERNAAIVQALQDQGAHVEELCLYEWLMPEDTLPLQDLVSNIIAQNVDAVVFTSQVQVRHLFQIAADLHLSQELMQAMNSKTIVASVGPTCTGVLQDYGVKPHVIPEHPKMGHLVKALVEYFTLYSA